MSVNKVNLSGYLGKDPKVKIYDSGARRATIILATKEKYLNSIGQAIESIQWHKLVAWGRTAEQVEKLLHKGSHINMEGRLHYYKANKGESGLKTFHEIVLDRFDLQVA